MSVGRPDKKEEFGINRIVAAKAALKKANETYLADPLRYLFCYGALAALTLQIVGVRIQASFYFSMGMLIGVQVWRWINRTPKEEEDFDLFPDKKTKTPKKHASAQ